MAADEQAATESARPHPRVLIANINRGTISTPMALGMLNSIITGAAVSAVVVESGPYLDAGRNKAVANAYRVTVEGAVDLPHQLELAWDWLLFVDSDIEFTQDHIRILFDPVLHDTYDPYVLPVISGVYVNPFDDAAVPGEEADEKENGGQPGHFGPVVYEWVQREDLLGELAGVPTWAHRRISRKGLSTLPPVDGLWNDGSVCEVAATGAGFLAIHREFLDLMQRTYPEPMVWFDEPIRGGVHCGEDFGFCLRVRDMGYPVLVNRACTPMHHKTTKLL
jgi:hypothetical protein